MKELKLANTDLKALISAEDFDKILALNERWIYDDKRGVRGTSGRGLFLSKIIMGVDRKDFSFYIDHINHNKLDNTRANLRKCSHSQNMMNRRSWSKLARGVKKKVYKGRVRFEARIHLNKKYIHLGTFLTIEEASLAYDNASNNYFKEFKYNEEKNPGG